MRLVPIWTQRWTHTEQIIGNCRKKKLRLGLKEKWELLPTPSPLVALCSWSGRNTGESDSALGEFQGGKCWIGNLAISLGTWGVRPVGTTDTRGLYRLTQEALCT